MAEPIREKIIQTLKSLTGKRFVYLTDRGNKSILLSLKIAKQHRKEKVIVQDQGGWITYLQYPEKLKMPLMKVATNYGIVIPDQLTFLLDASTVFLVNSLSGYFAEQPMALISSICKQKESFLINDASGSIGTEAAKIGDIIVCSFGESKPINLDYGGFIAFDDESFYDNKLFDDIIFNSSKYDSLLDELEGLNDRLAFFERKNSMIKTDLAHLNILHKDKRGINVVISFKDNFEKERIINYCNKYNFEYTECPRYIRVETNAISIEVKRLIDPTHKKIKSYGVR